MFYIAEGGRGSGFDWQHYGTQQQILLFYII